MGRFFGKRWKIDGVTAGPISRHYPANGRYSVIFERDDAFLEQIEKINWAKPTIQRLSEDANEQGLPEGYGFKVVDIKYDNSGRQELLCRGWFLPPNTYDCGSFVVNGTAVVGKEPKKPYNRCKSTQKGAELYEISI